MKQSELKINNVYSNNHKSKVIVGVETRISRDEVVQKRQRHVQQAKCSLNTSAMHVVGDRRDITGWCRVSIVIVQIIMAAVAIG